jgi:hypothetical protein
MKSYLDPSSFPSTLLDQQVETNVISPAAALAANQKLLSPRDQPTPLAPKANVLIATYVLSFRYHLL